MKRNDFIIIFVILIVIGGLYFTIQNMNNNKKAKELAVFLDGKQVDTFSLYEDVTAEFKSENGRVNTVEIKSGKVRIIHSNCLNKICANTAPISTVGEAIVCLPHRFYVEIIGEKEGEIDAFAK